MDSAVIQNPNNYVAWGNIGFYYIRNNQPEKAVDNLKKAHQLKSDNAVIVKYIGDAYGLQAQNTNDKHQKKLFYKEAIYYYDKAKLLDPDMKQINWGYKRYSAYYNYYGEDAPETKQAEKWSHY